MKLNKYLGKILKTDRGGYAVLVVGVLFAVGMVVVSTQIAKQTVNYQRSMGNTLEEAVDGKFAEAVMGQALERLMMAGSGYFEFGNVLDFRTEENGVRASLGLPAAPAGKENRDLVINYDYYGASLVPVPTVYNFSVNGGATNNLEIASDGTRFTHPVDLGFYENDSQADCIGRTQLNIFSPNNRAISSPNYDCGTVGIGSVRVGNDYRSGFQRYVVAGKGETPNFYYTVPSLGTGSAGEDCAVHSVAFGDKWAGTDEFIDPLDHPCNWNRVEKGSLVKFGLDSYSRGDVVKATQGRVSFNEKSSLATTGTNLEADVATILEQAYYEKLGKDETLVLRLRLRCADGSTDCHPQERMEFYDSYFLNDTNTNTHEECVDESGQQVCSHTYRQLAEFNLTDPLSDFTQLVFGYGIYDDGRVLPMRGDYNLGDARESRLAFILNGENYDDDDFTLIDARNNLYSVVSVDKLRSYSENLLNLVDFPKNIRSQQGASNTSSYRKINEYDNQNKISNFALNYFEFPYQEQGFGYEYNTDYFQLHLLDSPGYEGDLKNPEFVLQSLESFIEVLNNKSNSDRPLTFNDFEYQIVSSRTIGLEKGYIVYDFGLGERVVSDEFDVANAVRTGFVNVSN